MKIAVPVEGGKIFEHFGKTEEFKVYIVEDGVVTSTKILDAEGQGHGALAALLAGYGVNTLICGGIGEGAQRALAEADIELIAGASGDADEAVAAYLRGELESGDPACGSCCGHHEDGQECCEEKASGAISGPNVGKTCRTHYWGTFNDGTQFDSSYDRGEPLEFVCGAGMMIPGFDAAVAKMKPGEIVDVHLMPEEAYGLPNPANIIHAEISQLPGAESLSVGQQVYLYTQDGRPVPVKVTAKDETTITLDANHEMAGKELNFRIELVEVKDK